MFDFLTFLTGGYKLFKFLKKVTKLFKCRISCKIWYQTATKVIYTRTVFDPHICQQHVLKHEDPRRWILKYFLWYFLTEVDGWFCIFWIAWCFLVKVGGWVEIGWQRRWTADIIGQLRIYSINLILPSHTKMLNLKKPSQKENLNEENAKFSRPFVQTLWHWYLSYTAFILWHTWLLLAGFS